ncbi:MAG: TNT domain-containing protein [Lachnospiraceae bacterium]|nr:TNT domain-containing protein [Lachnospiraceae bacterium]
MKKNYLGQEISGRKEFLSEDYGYYDKDGNEHVYWKPEDDDVDSDGFDKHNQEENGSYIQDIVLPYGKLICRYGNIRGRITTDLESKYENLSLPYIKESVEYHVYRVVADGLKVKCTVSKGKVAPMFDSNGGAVQYKHYQSIANEVNQGKLEEVFL